MEELAKLEAERGNPEYLNEHKGADGRKRERESGGDYRAADCGSGAL